MIWGLQWKSEMIDDLIVYILYNEILKWFEEKIKRI